MAGFIEPGAGDLRDPIELLKRTTAASGSSDLAHSYAAADPPGAYARIKTFHGGRVISGVETDTLATHNFTIRHRTDWRDDAWDFVRHDGWLYEVVTVEDPGEGRRWLEILCRRVKASV